MHCWMAVRSCTFPNNDLSLLSEVRSRIQISQDLEVLGGGLEADSSNPDIPEEFKLKYDRLHFNFCCSIFALFTIGIAAQKMK